MFGPLYPLNKHGDLYFLIVLFETRISRKLLREVFKKKLLDNFISEESPWEKQNNSFRRWSLLGSCHNEKVECISENLPVRIRFPADYTKLNRTHFSQEMKKGLLISLALNSNQVRRSCVNWKIWKMKKNVNLTWPTHIKENTFSLFYLLTNRMKLCYIFSISTISWYSSNLKI